MKWSIPSILLLTAIIGGIRCMPNYPARGVSWAGSYEAFAHVIVGAMLCGPVVFWMTDKRSESEHADALASISFWCGMALTFGIEAVLFFAQVPYPWTK